MGWSDALDDIPSHFPLFEKEFDRLGCGKPGESGLGGTQLASHGSLGCIIYYQIGGDLELFGVT